VTQHLPAGSLLLRVEAEPLEDTQQNPLVVLRLVEVAFPFLSQLGIVGAPDGGLIDLDSSLLRLQRLVQKLVCLFSLHCFPLYRFR
jgi:hypothetical protein